MTDEQIIDQIIHSLKNYNLRDIKKIAQMDTVLASFTLCSCFVEQMSGFRYAKVKHKTGNEMFKSFVKDYLSQYDPSKLREDLRNRLVHNYSLGETYSLTMRSNDYHLKPDKNGRLILNLENFIDDIDGAFTKWNGELRTNDDVRKNALTWFSKFQIIG